MTNAIREQAVRALAGLMLGAAAILSAQVAQAQSAGTVIAGPYTVTLPTPTAVALSKNFAAPTPIQGSYIVRVQLSTANSLNLLSLKLNGAQIFSASDFAGGAASVDKLVTLLATNSVTLVVLGTTGTRITVTVFAVAMPQPTALAPNPLALNAGTGGTLTATLSPAPTASGTLTVSSSNTGVATVPSSVSFASGQTSVPIPVTAVAGGSAIITASANGGQATATVNVNAVPTASLTSPAPNSVYSAPASIALSANAADADGTVAKVDFFDGATLVGTSTAAPYGVTLTNVAAGAHSFSARATDNLGATGTSAPVNVTVDAPPTVTLTSPANNAIYAEGASVTLTATASDAVGNVSKVDFYQGTTLLGTATAAPYTFAWTSVPAGNYSLTAVATNDSGETTTSAAVNITVRSAVATVYYIETDHLNTPRLIEDQNGNAVWRNDNTEPFGDSVPNSDPNNTGAAFDFPLRFPGQYFDRETRLAYNMARNYDPATGRFVEGDPLGVLGLLREQGAIFQPGWNGIESGAGIPTIEPEDPRMTISLYDSSSGALGGAFSFINIYAYANDNPVGLFDFEGMAPSTPGFPAGFAKCLGTCNWWRNFWMRICPRCPGYWKAVCIAWAIGQQAICIAQCQAKYFPKPPPPPNPGPAKG